MLRLALTILTFSLTVSACSKSDSGAAQNAPPGLAAPASAETPGTSEGSMAAPPSPAADEFRFGACEVKVEGDLSLTVKTPGGRHAAGSDYWMSEADLEQAVRMFAGTGPEGEKRFKEGMAKDPKIYTVLLNCSGGNLALNFQPGQGSRYADVPMSPKTYKLTSPASAGEFGLMFSIDRKDFFRVSAPGTLDITRFDTSGISGTFSFEAEEQFPAQGKPKRKIKVSGKIDFKCEGFSKCTTG